MEGCKTLGYFLAQSLRIYKMQATSMFKEQGIELTFDQFVIMQILKSNSDIIQQDLANHLQRDKSIIVRQIECLLKRELVAHLSNSDDKRKKNLILTKKGLLLLAQMQQIGSEVTNHLLSGVSDTDLEIFRNVLTRIQENGESIEETCSCQQIFFNKEQI